jgi:hypothetical protein
MGHCALTALLTAVYMTRMMVMTVLGRGALSRETRFETGGATRSEDHVQLSRTSHRG